MELQELITRGQILLAKAPKRFEVFKLVNGRRNAKDIALKTGKPIRSTLDDLKKMRVLELIRYKKDKNGEIIKKENSFIYEKNPLLQHIPLSHYFDPTKVKKQQEEVKSKKQMKATIPIKKPKITKIQEIKEKKIRVGIITAIKEERDAVNELIYNCSDKKNNQSKIYFHGLVHKEIPNLEIFHYFAGKGSKVIAETTQLLTNHKPHYVFLVGIAAGISESDANYGDIIIADNVTYYEIGDMIKDDFVSFPDSNSTSPTLINHLKNFPYNIDERKLMENLLNFSISSNQRDLIDLQKDEIYDIDHRKKIAPFFCGEKIVEDSPKFIEQLKKRNRRAKAIDQESWHVLQCCLSDEINNPKMIVIKSVSDYANKPNRQIRKKLRYVCARIASGFLFSYLNSGKLL